MQLEILFTAQAVEPIKAKPQAVQAVHACSMREFRECQEIERDLLEGRGNWLYKQLERELRRQEAQRKEESRVLASGWR